MHSLLVCYVLCLAKSMLRPRTAWGKNWPATLVSEATGCSHTCAAKTNYNPVKHLIKCHSCSVCFIRNMSLLLEMSDIFDKICLCCSDCCALSDSCRLVTVLFHLRWSFFFFFYSDTVAMVDIDFCPCLPPQAPPLKLTAITDPFISAAQASLWSLSMMGSARTWWVSVSLNALLLYLLSLSVAVFM